MTPRKLRKSALVLLIALVAGFSWLVVRNRDREADGLPGLLETALTTCANDPACLERETDRLVAAFGIVDVVRAAGMAYRSNSQLLPNCHRYMHRLGFYVTPLVLGNDVPVLSESWTDCGAGLIHGSFENIPVSDKDPEELKRVLALCENPEFSETNFRYHSCVHAVGHSVFNGVDADLERGELLCSSLKQDDTFSSNHPCLAGLYMADRDSRLLKTTPPTTPGGWDDLLRHCARSPQVQTCVLAYAEIATKGGRSSTLAYLDWCLEADAGAASCLRFVGQGGAFAQLSTPGGDLNAGTCQQAATVRGLKVDTCLEGIENALSARGVPTEDLRTRACELIRESGADCPDALAADLPVPGR